MHQKTRFLAAAILTASSTLTLAETTTTEQVLTQQGIVEGINSNGVTSFRGIPYAKAPVGELRWRAPQPAERWDGVKETKSFKPDCMQPIIPNQDFVKLELDPSEDCLYLNVWNADAKHEEPLPVMVWIYGGAWLAGGSSVPAYNGETLAQEGVVVVSFNYRVGRMGFFAHPQLSKEAPDEPKGNYGIMDQIAALTWVKNNISAFGGDPENVTIFGESAGGGSVEALIQSPLAANLFHKAISQSSGPTGVQTGRAIREDLPTRPSAETQGVAFAKAKGIANDEHALVKLRALAPEEFLNFAEGLPDSEDSTNVKWGGPMLDGKVLVREEYKTYSEGLFNKVPLMTGATSGDLPGPIVNGQIAGGGIDLETALRKYAPYQDEVLALFDPENKREVDQIAYNAGAAWFMIEPARFVASVFSENKLPTYHYRVSYIKDSLKDEWKYGTPHASEIPFVFGTLDTIFDDVTPTDEKVSRQMRSYWTNFAKTGNPNSSKQALWPEYSKKTDLIMDVRPDGTIYTGPDPMKAKLDVLEKVAEGRNF